MQSAAVNTLPVHPAILKGEKALGMRGFHLPKQSLVEYEQDLKAWRNSSSHKRAH